MRRRLVVEPSPDFRCAECRRALVKVRRAGSATHDLRCPRCDRDLIDEALARDALRGMLVEAAHRVYAAVAADVWGGEAADADEGADVVVDQFENFEDDAIILSHWRALPRAERLAVAKEAL